MDRKVCLVTGGATGIGRAICYKFASNGYDVVINYNTSKDEAFKLERELCKLKIKAKAIGFDITDENAIINAKSIIESEFGHVDVLINNAGIDIPDFFKKKTVDNIKKTFDVNVIGAYLMSKHFSRYMLDNKYGKIINISSTNGINTYYPVTFDYDASKAALISLTHNLAVEYSPYICVNAICPGFIGTENELDGMDDDFIKQEEEKILVKRKGKPEEVASLAYYLASSEADFINNSIIRIDGGQYGSN